MGGVMLSWKIYGGCPFTVWENRYREIEEKGSAYLGSCLPHYAMRWFGWKIPGKYFTLVLVTLLILPIVVGII
jgi:hypothetical protein